LFWTAVGAVERKRKRKQVCPPSQGDQIGRNFVYWALDSFGRFSKLPEIAQHKWATFFQRKK
jgi:hypothetical protein